MELKKILSELEKADDINKLSIEELKEKYYKDEATYNEFVENYSRFFCGHYMYQLRVVDHYAKIVDLIRSGNSQFSNDNNIAYFEKILKCMNYSVSNYRVNGARVDDKYESLYLFNSTIMPSNSLDTNYSSIVDGIYQGGLKYSYCHEDSISDLFMFLYYKFKTEKMTREDLEELMKSYTDEHGMMSICNDTDFLLFANYMINQNKTDVDNKFIDDVKAIIRTSEFLQDMGYTDKEFNKSEYRKLSQFTLKSIAQAKKKIQKREEVSIKRAIKLNKSSNK